MEDITRVLGLRMADLFFDNGEPNSTERRQAMQQREWQAQERARLQREGDA